MCVCDDEEELERIILGADLYRRDGISNVAVWTAMSFAGAAMSMHVSHGISTDGATSREGSNGELWVGRALARVHSFGVGL